MEKLLKSPYRKFDFILFGATTVLLVIGLSTIQSTVIAGSINNEVLDSGLINIQILSIVTGFLLFLLAVFFNYRYLVYLAPVIYIAVLAILVGVLYLGSETRDVTRWFVFGPISFQPSTISALLLVVVYAAFFSTIRDKINRIHYLVTAFVLVAPPVGLILMEPDLGVGVIAVLTWFGLLHFTSLHWSRLILIYLAAAAAIPIAWQSIANYQKERIFSFLDPASDALGSGYNALQSIIAVGSGRIVGRGWGHGTQSHLQFLPEQHTDFIFATFAEEQGFIGALIILLSFGLIIWRSFVIMQKSRDYFGQLLVGGVIIWLTLHVFINIGMNLGIAPITGLPLPLVSYGGTAIVTTLLALGLVESVAIHE